MEVRDHVYISKGKSLSYYTSASFLFHIFIVLVLFILGKNFLSQLNAKKEFNIKLLESSVKVDMVAMPKLSLQELKKIEIPSQVENVPTPKKIEKSVSQNDSKVEFKKKSSKKNFLNMLKGLSKQKTEKAQNIKKQKNTISDKDINNLHSLVLKGNKINKGHALTGSSLSSSELKEFSTYMHSITNHVRPNWTLPEYLANQELKCRIQVFFKSNGDILNTKIFESSGVEEYDQSALSAIKKSSPFPRVSEKFRSLALNGKVVLGFPL